MTAPSRAACSGCGTTPEVGVCFRCIRELHRRKRTIERMTRHAPPGSRWRRVRYRLGFGRC